MRFPLGRVVRAEWYGVCSLVLPGWTSFGAGDCRSVKILVVDDDNSFVCVLREILEAEGHEVYTASDGSYGYSRFLVSRPDLILTDIHMPVKDGIEMMQSIRDINPAVPTIYMSAELDRYRLRLEEERQKHAVTLLNKPFSKGDLVALISASSDGSVAQKQRAVS